MKGRRSGVSAKEVIGSILLGIVGVVVVGVLDTIVNLAVAQGIVWGLSMEHVNSGLEGPWLICVSLGALIYANSRAARK